MKIASRIAQVLLGLVFFVFGLNHVLHFIPMGPMPSGPAGQFAGALFSTGYIYAVTVFEVGPAILLLVNRYVPLALVLVGPVIVNILLFHAFMAPSGLPMAALLIALWLLVFLRVRPNFTGIFEQRTAG